MIRARLATPEDDSLLTTIVMHPDVRQWNELDGPRADFVPSKYTAEPCSFAVVMEDSLGPVGCFLAFAIEANAYAIHTNLLPSCRGVRAVEAAAAALRFAFVETDAEQLWTMVPECNLRAHWFAHSMAFKDAFKTRAKWMQGGKTFDVQHMRMDIDDWIQRLSTAPLGKSFHARLVEMGGEVDHVDDPVHDAYVGAAWAMTAESRLLKGVRIYGRWARAAGYLPYTVLSGDPLRIDIGTCVLRSVDNQFVIEGKT